MILNDTGPLSKEFSLFDIARHAKIGQFAMPVSANEHVFTLLGLILITAQLISSCNHAYLHISVANVIIVDILQAQQYLPHHFGGLRFGNNILFHNRMEEIATRDEFHHNIDELDGFLNVFNGNDKGVVEAINDLNFLLKSLCSILNWEILHINIGFSHKLLLISGTSVQWPVLLAIFTATTSPVDFWTAFFTIAKAPSQNIQHNHI